MIPPTLIPSGYDITVPSFPKVVPREKKDNDNLFWSDLKLPRTPGEADQYKREKKNGNIVGAAATTKSVSNQVDKDKGKKAMNEIKKLTSTSANLSISASPLPSYKASNDSPSKTTKKPVYKPKAVKEKGMAISINYDEFASPSSSSVSSFSSDLNSEDEEEESPEVIRDREVRDVQINKKVRGKLEHVSL